MASQALSDYSAMASELSRIQQQTQQQYAQAQQSQTQISKMSQSIHDLTALITALKDTVEANATPDPTPAPPPAPELPPLTQSGIGNLIKAHKDIFEGKREFFDTWLLGIRGALDEDNAALPEESQKFWWIYSKLGNQPKQTVEAYVSEKRNARDFRVDPFINYLTETFQDRHKKQSALAKLKSMKQGTRPFYDHYPRFEKELATAGGLSWSVDVKMDYLSNTLNEELKKQLVTVEFDQTDWNLVVERLRSIASKFEVLAKPSSLPPPSHAQPTPAVEVYDPMDIDVGATGIKKWVFSPALQAQNKTLEGKRAKWVSREELSRRRQEKRCNRCARKGCISYACPLKPAQRPKDSMTAYSAELLQEVEVDEEYNSSESKK
jgi:hypothetical protein